MSYYPLSKEDQEKLDNIKAFSCDIIASLSLVKDYDLKKLAHDISHFFGEHSEYELFKQTPYHDNYDPNYCPKSPDGKHKDSGSPLIFTCKYCGGTDDVFLG